MQVEIHLDFETYSEADLTSCGAHAYARDPSTDCLVARWRVKLGGSWLKPGEWRPGDDYPFEKYFDEDLVIYAWNSQFERLIWRHVMTPVYGWPELKLKQFICVSAWARSVAAAPAKLETAAAFFGQPAQKDMGGHRHMLTMCRPATESQQLKWLRGAVDRLGRDVDHEEAKRYHHTREAIDKLSGYCAKDVEAEIDIAEILPPFPETELQCFWENERINDRGLIVDLDFAEAAVSLVEIEQAYFERELARLTNGQIETVKQYQRHSAWVSEQLDERGVKMMTVYRDGKPKLSVASDIRSNLLAEDDLNPGFLPVHVRDVLEIIDQGSKAATSKFEGMLSRAVKDDEGNWRVHGLYMFAGAAQTGRYSSTGLQVHNLVRDVPKEAGDMIDWCIDGHQRGTLFNEFRAIVDQWAAAQKGKKQFVGRAKGKTQEANDYRGGQGGATTGANAGFVKGPIHALAACVRPAFTGCPRGRFKLVWGDWSSIEARTLPWLSLHQDADDLLARYRRNEDVYRYQAGKPAPRRPRSASV